ncbi:hypothetical protein MKW98_029155, partial [Papaver atlanticum]
CFQAFQPLSDDSDLTFLNVRIPYKGSLWLLSKLRTFGDVSCFGFLRKLYASTHEFPVLLSSCGMTQASQIAG